MRKAIGMVKVRLSRWMRQGPVGLAPVAFFDHRRETEAPCGAPQQARKRIEFQRGSQCEMISARLHFDSGRAHIGRSPHSIPVAVEPICRPLCRWRKVEFVVLRVRRSSDECLKAGRLPKLFSTRCGRCGWDPQFADLAGHQIGEHQTALAWPRDLDFDLRGSNAERVRMKFQRLAHADFAVYSASIPCFFNMVLMAATACEVVPPKRSIKNVTSS